MSVANSSGRPHGTGLLDDISAVAQDYLKTIWSATEWDDPPITTSALAAKFGTTPAAVTDAVQRLAGQGLLHYERYKPVRLSEQGERLAIAMVRRHRLLEMFLVSCLKYGWEEVHDEAERLEHAASDGFIDRIATALGNPTADPHGDPIPTKDGSTHRPPGAVRLSVAPPGRYLVTRISDADSAALPELAALGLVPDTFVEVIDRRATHLRITVGTAGPTEPSAETHVLVGTAPSDRVWLIPDGTPE